MRVRVIVRVRVWAGGRVGREKREREKGKEKNGREREREIERAESERVTDDEDCTPLAALGASTISTGVIAAATSPSSSSASPC